MRISFSFAISFLQSHFKYKPKVLGQAIIQYKVLLASDNVSFELFQIPMDTDGEMVELPMLNDYTGSKVKEEMSEFETKGVLQIVPVCNACHGGEQDNPKG